MKLFADRQQTGELLARKLEPFRDQANVIVLGLGGGGMPAAYAIAKQLRAPLDVFCVEPVRLRHFPDLCIGSVTSGGIRIPDFETLGKLHLADEAIDWLFTQALENLEEVELRVRGQRTGPRVRNQTVILVNDAATNDALAFAAYQALQELGAARVISAAPIECGAAARMPHSVALYSHPTPLTPEQIYEHADPVLEKQERRLLRDANAASLAPA